MKLTIELVPRTSWFNNLRSYLTSSQWEMVKKITFNKAQYRCEICKGKGSKHPVECHERWEYNDSTKVQKLVGTIALCPTCHQCKHMGLQFTRFPNRVPRLIKHMSKINGMSQSQTEDYIYECFRQHNERSNYDWQVDHEWIEKLFPKR